MKTKKNGKAKGKAAKGTEPRVPCECGCRAFPVGRRSRFLQGHDMKLKSALLKAGDKKK
jgi:hypothetical protein